MASSRIYRDLLLRKQHGLPLWIPDPDENLEEHTKQGISIGDLGILTNDGGFRYLFNIHAEADAPVNKDMRTPRSFTPLPMPPISKRGFIHVQKACIAENASFEMEGIAEAQANALGAGIGVDLTFTTTHERTAMLFLPHGADREDADGIGLYKEYTVQHGESWYKFVNEELKSDARNDSLYLVTGCDKSGSWALAAGSPRQGSSVKFAIQGTPGVAPGSVTAGFYVSWTNTSGIERRHYPSSMKLTAGVKNQCVFVRGLAIAIRTNWLTKPWLGKVRITEINTSTGSFSAVDNNVPFQYAAKQNPALLKAPQPPQKSANKSLSGELLDQEQDAIGFYDSEDSSGVMVENYPEFPKPVLSPGSYICEHLLSIRPDINLVIVHDNDWMTVTSSDDENIFTSNEIDYERLTTRVLQKSHLQVTQGMTIVLRRPYHDLATTIEGAIPDFLNALKDENQSVRTAVARLINEFSKQPHLIAAVKDAIPISKGLLKDGESDDGESDPDPIAAVLASVEDSSEPHVVTDVQVPVIDLLDLQKKDESGPYYVTALATSEFSKNQGLIEALDSLKNERPHIRRAAISAIAEYSKQPELVMVIKEGIPDVLNLLNDEDHEVRRATVSAIAEFSKQPAFVMAIKKGIPDVLRFLKNMRSDLRRAAISAIAEFSKQPDLAMVIKEGIPDVLNLMKDADYYVRKAAFSAVPELLKQPDLIIIIEKSIPELLNLLKATDYDVRNAAITMFVEFSTHPELVEATKEGIPHVLKLLQDTDYYIRRAAVSAVAEFLKQPDLIMAIKEAIPDIFDLLMDMNYDVRRIAISLIEEFSKQPELVMAMKGGLLDFSELLQDTHDDVRRAALSAIVEFSNQSTLSVSVKKGIPNLLNLLKDTHDDVRSSAILAITKFLEQPELIIAIKEGIPDVLSLLKDTHNDVRSSAILVITKFLEQPELVVAIKENIPDVLNLLKDRNKNVRRAAISVIAKFSKQSDQLMVLKEGIPDILYFLKDMDYSIYKDVISVIIEISKQPDLHMTIEKSIPDILNLLKDADFWTSYASVSAIIEFSKQPELGMAIEKGIPDIFLSLNNETLYIPGGAANLIYELSKQAHLVIAIESAMPILFTSLKGNSDVCVAAISVIYSLYKQCIISM